MSEDKNLGKYWPELIVRFREALKMYWDAFRFKEIWGETSSLLLKTNKAEE